MQERRNSIANALELRLTCTDFKKSNMYIVVHMQKHVIDQLPEHQQAQYWPTVKSLI